MGLAQKQSSGLFLSLNVCYLRALIVKIFLLAELKPRWSDITQHNKEERQEGKERDWGAGVQMIEVVGEKVGEKAIKAKQAGRRSALIERGEGGGRCWWEGRSFGEWTSKVPMPCRPLGTSGGRCDVWGPAPLPSSPPLPFPLVWCPAARHVLACLQGEEAERSDPSRRSPLRAKINRGHRWRSWKTPTPSSRVKLQFTLWGSDSLSVCCHLTDNQCWRVIYY